MKTLSIDKFPFKYGKFAPFIISIFPAILPFLNILSPIKTFKNSLGRGRGISKPRFFTQGSGFEKSTFPASFTTGLIFCTCSFVKCSGTM